MSNQKKYKYVNGAWLNKVSGYELVNMDFTEEFIDNLKRVPKNEKGIRKVTMGSQKADPNKWSIYENEFKPKTDAATKPTTPQDDLVF